MKKQNSTVMLFILLCVLLTVICGCGHAADENAVKEAEAYYNNSAKLSGGADGKAEDTAVQNRKIIEYYDFRVETKSFDVFIGDIKDTVKRLGGYTESSEIGGNSYYSDENRNAALKVRIPKDKQSEFSDFIEKNGNVVNMSVTTDDVTEQYIDIESHIKALMLEKETLEKLLTQSANVSDTLTVYEKLTDIIASIENYQRNLNHLDGLIDYTTFTLNIYEVEKETKVEKQSWFSKTLGGLTDNLCDVRDGILAFFSFLISGLPYWVLLGVAAFAFIIIRRRIKKKNAGKKKE